MRTLRAGSALAIAALISLLSLLSFAPRADAAAIAATGASPAAAPAGGGGFFPIAVWYGGGKARAPMLEPVDGTSAARWGRDLDQIKSAGFNTVKCWVDWATGEPKPGEFHFENLDLLMKLAQARGLRVIVQVYLDSAPDWVGRRYPDGRFVDRGGAVIESEAAPGFCIDHPGVRAEIVRFLEDLSRYANRSPALYAWDVWSEPHVINWAQFPYLTNPEFCYCPNSQRRFRAWLEAKYKTVEALNAAWYRRFERWDEVSPPRASTILSYTDYLDWRAFIDDKLAGDLRTRVEAIRRADPAHPVSSHAAVPSLFTSPTDGLGEPDDFKMSAVAGFFGTSLYPKHSESARPWPYSQLSAALDFARSAGLSHGKGFWIGELQAGQGATGMRIADPVDAHDLELWMWESLAHGAREIAVYAWYPMSSGFESNGYGLIDLDGSLTDRSRAAGRVAQIVAAHASDFLGAQPAPAEVAILYNRLSSLVGGAEPSLSRLGNAERDSLLGLDRAFAEQQVPVDFVDPGGLAADKLGQYKILFLPFPVMLSRETAEGVARYVKSGGTAVAEARLAWNDERGFASDAIPGAGLAEIFGGREKLIRPVDRLHLFVEAVPELPGFASRELVTSDAFQEDLDALPGATVLAHFGNGAAALTGKSYERGKAILVGSFPALSYQRQHDASTRRFFLALARGAGVTPQVEVTGAGTDEVEVRRLVSDRAEFVFVFNHAPTAADATVSLKLPWPAAQARDLVTDRPVELVQRPGAPTGVTVLHKNLAPGEILVLLVERR